jgi:RimJ/RimL family protein N-acetyltransferase
MELEPYGEGDLWLTEALETDPRVMAELGGPWLAEDAQAAHRRRLASVEERGTWWFKIVPDPAVGAVGTIGIWASEWAGAPISETGWMVLPEHQGRGHASAALRLLLERAADSGTWGDIHAFPGETNGASNALCRKFGFELLETVDVDYSGRPLRCNHWVWRAR